MFLFFGFCFCFFWGVWWINFFPFLYHSILLYYSILYFPILNQKVFKMIKMIMNPDPTQIISFLGGVRWVNFYYSSLFFHFKRKDVQDDIQMITNPDQSQIISPYQGRRRSSRTVDTPDFATRGLGHTVVYSGKTFYFRPLSTKEYNWLLKNC